MKKPKGIAAILRARRKLMDVTQMEAARWLGHSTAQYISNLERGLCEPSVEMAVALWEFYGGRRRDLEEMMVEMVTTQLRARIRRAKGAR